MNETIFKIFQTNGFVINYLELVNLKTQFEYSRLVFKETVLTIYCV